MQYKLSQLARGQDGQTLIETIVALAFLISGITAAVVVAIGALRVSDNAVNRVFAEQMAQEGVELMRGWRDATATSNKSASNWEYRNGIISGVEFWDWHDITNLIPAADDSVTIVMDHRKRFCITVISSGTNPLACPSDADRIFHNTDTGFYRNSFNVGEGAPSSAIQSTNFRRTITLTRKLVDVTDPTGPTYISVQANLSWKERSRPNILKYTVREDLYDWL